MLCGNGGTRAVSPFFAPRSDMQLLIVSVCALVSAIENSLLQAIRARARCPGRPPLSISEDHIRYLFQNDFSLADMSHMLGCSIRTVHRRLKALGLGRRDRYSSMTDAALDAEVLDIHNRHSEAGSRIVEGMLKSQGLLIQRERIRDSLRRIDPQGTQELYTKESTKFLLQIVCGTLMATTSW